MVVEHAAPVGQLPIDRRGAGQQFERLVVVAEPGDRGGEVA
jgi:hypothetical protein